MNMEWDDLHMKAKAVMPLDVQPKRYVVGVLLLDKSPQEQLTKFDFIWMKGYAVCNFLRNTLDSALEYT
jgi:hypothetical protein